MARSKTNSSLNDAKRAKKDEFYTQLSDIENELRHYKKHFKDKVVFCNCDDPYESNFFKYLAHMQDVGFLLPIGSGTAYWLGRKMSLGSSHSDRSMPFDYHKNRVSSEKILFQNLNP